MTHESSHVIINFATPIDSAKPQGMKVWHLYLVMFAIGFVAGALLV